MLVGGTLGVMELLTNIRDVGLAVFYGAAFCFVLFMLVKLSVTAVYQWFTGVKNVTDH